MATALDLPPDAVKPSEESFLEAVREHGWFDSRVFDHDNLLPSFNYSTGFWLNRGIPEVILFSLPREVSHDILWDVFRDAEGGRQPPTGRRVEGVFGNAPAFFFPVAEAHYEEYLGWAMWFYRWEKFPCLQLVWPDTMGRFPWEDGFEERFREDQPDLTEKGWRSALAE